MKKLLLIFLGGVIFSSCNNGNSSASEAGKDTSASVTATPPMNYPYKIDHPDNWETGSTQNTMNVLSSLKAWENKNVDESIGYFGDSVHIEFDGIDTKISRDSLKAMFNKGAASVKSRSIKMYDWESVISKDKNDEYVTLWYREYWEDMKGNKDSADIINDVKMKDGKIIGLDEFTRKLH
jgi:hypothetical protein